MGFERSGGPGGRFRWAQTDGVLRQGGRGSHPPTGDPTAVGYGYALSPRPSAKCCFLVSPDSQLFEPERPPAQCLGECPSLCVFLAVAA